jgi:2-dehydropantoate 2-reductase
VQEGKWPNIAVVGAGAVGCYFGGMLARAGAPVMLIGRAQHVEEINQKGLFLESINFQEFIRVAASTDVVCVREADVVFLCVKTTDTEEAARSIAQHLAKGATVVSLQNGVDNVDRIRLATGIEAIPAVVYVAAEMTAPGKVEHNGRGDLTIGQPSGRNFTDDRRKDVANIAELFVRAGVPCTVSDNIEAELWTKLIINCAYNAISALGRAKYGPIIQNPLTRAVLVQAVEEAVAVARGAGVELQADGMIEAALKVGEAMQGATSSTAQDIARGKRTEIDSLNGYVARRGMELGIPTPVNQALHALVKLLEDAT